MAVAYLPVADLECCYQSLICNSRGTCVDAMDPLHRSFPKNQTVGAAALLVLSGRKEGLMDEIGSSEAQVDEIGSCEWKCWRTGRS